MDVQKYSAPGASSLSALQILIGVNLRYLRYLTCLEQAVLSQGPTRNALPLRAVFRVSQGEVELLLCLLGKSSKAQGQASYFCLCCCVYLGRTKFDRILP